MPTAKPVKKPSGLKRAAQPSKEGIAKSAKSARKASTVAGKEASREEHADTTKSFMRDAGTKLRTWVSESKATKSDAKKADADLYNKKAELLRGVLQQMIGQARAGSTKAANKTRSTDRAPQNPTVCKCGKAKLFCKHPCCLNHFCEVCESSDKHKFDSCAVCSKACSDRQAPGPYCKRHARKYLAVCGDCGVVACDNLVQECEACNGRFCTDCLKNEQCETCNYEWQNVRDEYGIESDDSYGEDPFGY